jgi:hypothetical protein
MNINYYNNLTFNQVQQYFPDEPILSIIRHYRNHLLMASDWAMAPDAPTDKQAWADYRQALRDFPNNWTPSETIDFPVSPLEGSNGS